MDSYTVGFTLIGLGILVIGLLIVWIVNKQEKTFNKAKLLFNALLSNSSKWFSISDLT